MGTASPGAPTARQLRADAIQAMFARPPDSFNIDERSSQNAAKHFLSNVGPPLELTAIERIDQLFRDFRDDLKPTDSFELTLIRNLARCAVRLDLHEEASFSATMASKASRLILWENQRQTNLLPIISRFDAPVLISKSLFQRVTETLIGARLVLSRMDNCVDWVRENKLFDEPFRVRIMNAFGICTPEDLEALCDGWPNLAELFLNHNKLALPSRPPAALYEELLDFMKQARQALKDQGPELEARDRETRWCFEKSLEVEQDPSQAALWNRYLTSAERGYFRNWQTLNSYRKQKQEAAQLEAKAKAKAKAETEAGAESSRPAQPVVRSQSRRQPKLSRDQRRVLRRKTAARTETAELAVKPPSTEQVSITPTPEAGFVSQTEATGLDEFLRREHEGSPTRSTVTAQQDQEWNEQPGAMVNLDTPDAQLRVNRGIVATPPPDPLGQASG